MWSSFAFNFVLLSNNIHQSRMYFEIKILFWKVVSPLIMTSDPYTGCSQMHPQIFYLLYIKFQLFHSNKTLTRLFSFVCPVATIELVSVRIIAPDWKLNLLFVQIWSEVTGSRTVFARFEQKEGNFYIKFYCSWHFLQFRCQVQYYGTINSGDRSIGRTSL